MKINMAEGDYFNIGMKVSCTTCHGQKITGEVMAFDISSRMLALKSQPASGKPNTHDVSLLNLSLVSNVSVLEEASEPPPPLTNLNIAKIDSRVRANKDEKNRAINYIGVGVSSEAQSLLHSITRTLKEVRWEGHNIVVMEQVKIIPPYNIESCHLTRDGGEALLKQIKKIVDKHHRDLGNHGDRDDRESSVSSSSS